MMKWIPWVKYGLLALLALFLVALCWTDNYPDKPISEIEEALLKEQSVASLHKGNANDLRRYYGLDETMFDGVTLYLSEATMEVDELLVVKMKSTDQTETVESAVEKRVEQQKESFEGYGAEQTALLSNHVLEIKGQYVFFGVSKNAQLWESEFIQAIKK
ncbi:DUF4358 domain-containing protein [Massiliimalia timonensis]|uniref:DUF4358 domain-containing protein n=1 Tax=Massiliimalia timonensis TaxID=1987501 RepID=UPI00189CEF38|nr:DUF4358 domain-containing protein [Massiliimalia timonensis]